MKDAISEYNITLYLRTQNLAPAVPFLHYVPMPNAEIIVPLSQVLWHQMCWYFGVSVLPDISLGFW